MRKICLCGNKLKEKSAVREVAVELSNPGTIKFNVPTVKCEGCNKFIFSEDHAEDIFDKFDAARQQNKK